MLVGYYTNPSELNENVTLDIPTCQVRLMNDSIPTHSSFLGQKSDEKCRGDRYKCRKIFRIDIQQEGLIFSDSDSEIHVMQVTLVSLYNLYSYHPTPPPPMQGFSSPPGYESTRIIKAWPVSTELFNFYVRLNFINRNFLMIFVLFSDDTRNNCLNIHIFFKICMAVGDETSVWCPCHLKSDVRDG